MQDPLTHSVEKYCNLAISTGSSHFPAIMPWTHKWTAGMQFHANLASSSTDVQGGGVNYTPPPSST